MNKDTCEIICVDQCEGSVHDFTLYKNTVGNKIRTDIKTLADSGYQGINDYHHNSEIPKKKSKLQPLTPTDKFNNKHISRDRILIENINAKIKVFKIFSQKYRNRRKRHHLRMSLTCGIYNRELNL